MRPIHRSLARSAPIRLALSRTPNDLSARDIDGLGFSDSFGFGAGFGPGFPRLARLHRQHPRTVVSLLPPRPGHRCRERLNDLTRVPRGNSR